MIISIDSTILGALVRRLGGEVRLSQGEIVGNPNISFETTVDNDFILRVDK